MATNVRVPTDAELRATLGSVAALWTDIIRTVSEAASPLDIEWKPSKSEFSRLCLLVHKKRTLLYLTPEPEKVRVAIVLGERAYGLALASSLPATIKQMFSEAKPYAEGRGIRFLATSPADLPTIKTLVAIKTTPK